jgi:hypothetical protein
MAFTESRVFRQYVADILDNTTAMDLTADTFKVSLYGNGITPDRDVSAANSAYGVGQWLAANAITSSTDWPVGGVSLASRTLTTPSSGIVMFDAADTASGAAATLANVYGLLVYDDTIASPVADQGVCYNYLGGANNVTAGTFTVIWNANGIFRVTV